MTARALHAKALAKEKKIVSEIELEEAALDVPERSRKTMLTASDAVLCIQRGHIPGCAMLPRLSLGRSTEDWTNPMVFGHAHHCHTHNHLE